MGLKVFGLTLVLAAAVAAQAQAAACELKKWADLPITFERSAPLIDTRINGRDARFLLDTGASISTLSQATAKTYGLALSPAPADLRMFGLGGAFNVNQTTVDVFTLGATPIPDVDFLVVGGGFRDYAGILGEDILHIADIEIDVAGGALRLFRPKGCESANLAYWAKDQGVSVLTLEPQPNGTAEPVATAYVNGVRMRVMFDTGAHRSLMTLSAAARAGVRPDSPGVTPGGSSFGLDERELPTWIAPVAEFKLGGEMIKNTKLRIGGGGVAGIAETDILLGADFFRSHHVLISNTQHRLYFTYAGGPVFDLSTKTQAPAPP